MQRPLVFLMRLSAIAAAAVLSLSSCALPQDNGADAHGEVANANEYQSSFGFRAEIPSNWIVLSREELRDNPDLFEGFESLPGVGEIDPELVVQIQQRVRTGQVELLFRASDSPSSFADNINVIKQIARLPGKTELEQACRQLPTLFAQAFGRPTVIHTCELTAVSGRAALHLEFDGSVEGTRSVQYWIQKSESVQLIITSTATHATFPLVKGEFAGIVDSLEFTDPDGS